MLDKTIDFITELVNRITADTPKFFRILRNIGLVITTISSVLIAQHIPVPSWLEWLQSTHTLVVSIATALISQLTVKDVNDSGELPITKK